MASYRWLSDNYQDGDRIFLFGEALHFMLLTLRIPHTCSRLFPWCLPSSSIGGYDCSGEPVSSQDLSVVDDHWIFKVGLLLPGNNEQIPL